MWWILSLSLGLVAAQDTEVVRLKVGREVVGTIGDDDFNEATGIRLRRVSDGSVLDLRWDQMHPDDVRRIRASRGYLPDEPDPIYVEAVRITLVTGFEMIGRITESNAETFVLKQRAIARPLSWAGVRDKQTIQVNALEVYEAEELYAEELYAEPPQSALDHYNLALFCESLHHWERAVEHLAAVQELDPEFKKVTVETKLGRAEMRLSAADDAAVLREANTLVNRERFDAALELLAGFLEQNPNSQLIGEFHKEIQLVQRLREQWLQRGVQANFFAFLERFAGRLAADREISINEARKRMELDATEAVVNTLAERFGTEVEELQTIWETARGRAAPRTATYGAGTFTLGPDQALDGLVDEKQEESRRGREGEAETEKGGTGPKGVEDRIREMIERRKKEQQNRERRGPRRRRTTQMYDVPPNKDQWWVDVASSSERRSYLLAYWAEREPQVEAHISVQPRTCRRCSGEGVLKFSATSTSDGRQPCDRCKGLRVDRVVRFR